MIQSIEGNVVYVDFKKTSPREHYLYILATELDEFDFEDIVEAINDTKHYERLDPELKQFVDLFFQQAV